MRKRHLANRVRINPHRKEPRVVRDHAELYGAQDGAPPVSVSRRRTSTPDTRTRPHKGDAGSTEIVEPASPSTSWEDRGFQASSRTFFGTDDPAVQPGAARYARNMIDRAVFPRRHRLSARTPRDRPVRRLADHGR